MFEKPASRCFPDYFLLSQALGFSYNSTVNRQMTVFRSESAIVLRWTQSMRNCNPVAYRCMEAE